MIREDNDVCSCCTCGVILATVFLLAAGVENKPREVTFSSPMFLLGSNLTTVSVAQLWNDTAQEEMRCFIPFVVTTAKYGGFQLVSNFRRLRGGHAGGHSGHSGHSHGTHTTHYSRYNVRAVRTTTSVIILHTMLWGNNDQWTYLNGNAKKYVLYQDQICVHDDAIFVQADEDLWGKAWFGRAEIS